VNVNDVGFLQHIAFIMKHMEDISLPCNDTHLRAAILKILSKIDFRKVVSRPDWWILASDPYCCQESTHQAFHASSSGLANPPSRQTRMLALENELQIRASNRRRSRKTASRDKMTT